MLTIEDIKKGINRKDFDFYGIRVDEEIHYNIGEIFNNSHQLLQDPVWDDDGELVYPLIEGEGLYDAGELDGTCVIGFDPDDDDSIAFAIEQIKIYSGNHFHLLGGNDAESGNDTAELIIRNAEVLEVY